MRTSQTRRFEEAAVVIGVPLSGQTELPETYRFDVEKLTNKPEIYMKVWPGGVGFGLRRFIGVGTNPRRLKRRHENPSNHSFAQLI
jgi:hypothetical protein